MKRCSKEIQAFWSEMAPCDRIGQIYENDEKFLDGLRTFVIEGFKRAESVIIIATKAHLKALENRLDSPDLPVLIAQDKYIAQDAEEMLATFMVNDWPDEKLFEKSITALLNRAAGNQRNIRAFGEMVALLWAQGHNGATIRLEHFWNDLAKHHAFPLLYDYPKGGLTQNAAESIKQICSAHSKTIGTPVPN
jgi:hypothetical protein